MYRQGDKVAEFKLRLRDYRKSKGWTMKFIANKMNIPYVTWVSWEGLGQEPPSYFQEMIMEKLERIAKGEM